MSRFPRPIGASGPGRGSLTATLGEASIVSRWEGELTGFGGGAGDVEIRVALQLGWSGDIIEGHGRMLELASGQVRSSGDVLVSGTLDLPDTLDLQIWLECGDREGGVILGQGHVSSDLKTMCGEWSMASRLGEPSPADAAGGIFQLRRVD